MGFNTKGMALSFLVCLLIAIVSAQTKPGCNSTCGDLNIPYPFGTSEGCYYNNDEKFKIDCYNFPDGTFMANSSRGNSRVLNISLDDGELHGTTWVASRCFDSLGNPVSGSNMLSFRLGKFNIYNSKNKLYVVGCDAYAFIVDYGGTRFYTGCSTGCMSISDVSNGTCSGIGCCQNAFAQGFSGYNITLRSYYNNTRVSQFNRCNYAFIAEDGAFNFSTQDLKDLREKKDFPVVLNWAIANESCVEAQKNRSAYACMENSECVDSKDGYRCRCKEGYHGNPYLSYGCQDVDECNTNNNCSMSCHNSVGNYSCSCPRGYKGDGRKDGSGCTRKDYIIEIALGISVGLLVLITLTYSLRWVHKQRTDRQLRKKFFEQNGGFLLQERLSELQLQYYERIKIFKEVELVRATNNFHESQILGQGGQGVVYKGLLPNNQTVAIKKSRMGGADQRQIKDFINEIVVLSQINNRNVVKLLGCCLETETPMLVYEFVSNGNLFDRIDPEKNKPLLPWETRLSIAAETAEAVSYLHSVVSTPIIHRDIKSSNILLDSNDKAKVSDFGASRLVPLDKTQISTIVQGTLGYMDPECFQTGQLNDKSDVYSFGVVLIELLTGKNAIQSFAKNDGLAMHFVSSMKEDCLMEVLDTRVVNQSNINQVKEVASLARKCVRALGEQRPTMDEVAMELKGLIAMQKHSSIKGEVKSEESEHLLADFANAYGGDGTSISASYGSTQNQIAFEIEDADDHSILLCFCLLFFPAVAVICFSLFLYYLYICWLKIISGHRFIVGPAARCIVMALKIFDTLYLLVL